MRSPWRAIPCAALVDDAVDDCEIEHVTLAGLFLAVEDVELGVAEGSGDLVLDDLDLGADPDSDITLLEPGARCGGCRCAWRSRT